MRSFRRPNYPDILFGTNEFGTEGEASTYTQRSEQPWILDLTSSRVPRGELYVGGGSHKISTITDQYTLIGQVPIE